MATILAILQMKIFPHHEKRGWKKLDRSNGKKKTFSANIIQINYAITIFGNIFECYLGPKANKQPKNNIQNIINQHQFISLLLCA